jgi:hypothetical protein
MRQGAPGVICSAAMMPSLRRRWLVDGASRARWRRNSAMAIHIALPDTLFDKLGVRRLAP